MAKSAEKVGMRVGENNYQKYRQISLDIPSKMKNNELNPI